MALFGEGGFEVSILAVAPLVLRAPTAFYGMRQLTRRRRHSVRIGRARNQQTRHTCLRRSGGFSGLPRLDSNQQPSG
jgi:hypothetical protein